METFVSVIIIVFAALQIILFFKIWGMTNNVRKIKEQKEGERDIYYYILLGDREKLKEYLDDRLCKELANCYKFENHAYDYKKRYAEICNLYKEMYDKFDFELPKNSGEFEETSVVTEKYNDILYKIK